MPIDLLDNRIEYGKVRHEWDFPEFIPYERSKLWYIIAGIVIFLLLLFSFLTANLLFAILIVMVSAVVFYLQSRHPRMLNIKLTDDGMVIENLFYSYDEIRSFWVTAEHPEDHNVYFEFKSISTPRLNVPFMDINPVRLQTYLAQFIEIDPDREGIPISETLSRWLKL